MKSRPVGLECKISSGVDSVSVYCVPLSSRVASGAVGFWLQIVDGEKAMKDAWIFSTASDGPHRPPGQRPLAPARAESCAACEPIVFGQNEANDEYL